MAPSEDEETISLLGEALEKLMATENEQSDEHIHSGDTMDFHRFMDLPPELRDQIRKEAIKDEQSCKQKGTAKLAAVSQEWLPDVEKVLFSKIRIDPANEEDASKFKEIFVQRRQRLLKCLHIIIDDRDTGPWYLSLGLSQISLFMENVGQVLSFIDSWVINQDECEETAPFMDICFVSLDLKFRAYDEGRPWDPSFRTTSLWTEDRINLATAYGVIPPKMPLWAIKAAFPASLSIAAHLTMPPDCVPLPATMALMQTMPSLVSCSLAVSFTNYSIEGVQKLTDLIHQLPRLTPHLRTLNFHNADETVAPDFATVEMKEISAALQEYSQSLEELCVDYILMHQTFFHPFSEQFETSGEIPKWRWPTLKSIRMDFGTFVPYLEPEQPPLSAVDLVIAAGRAAMAMPALKHLHISSVNGRDDYDGRNFTIDRESSDSRETPGKSLLKLEGFTEDEDQRILSAWVPFMGAEAHFVRVQPEETYTDDDDIDDDSEILDVPEINEGGVIIDEAHDVGVPDDDDSDNDDSDDDEPVDTWTIRIYEANPKAPV